MCGLVGLVCKKQNGFSADHKNIFSTLLFVDTLRGYDSTGVFVVNNEGDVYVAKDEGMAPLFMASKEYDEAMRRAWNRGSAMVGHNRAATRGVVNDKNAHPFNVDNNIILVHNGTMRSDHKKHADVEVDSHAIAHLIHEKGSVEEALGAFYGAYALIWYNVEKGELNMVRNDERPLFWMELEDAWVWSSEASMLEFAVNRAGAKTVKGPTQLPVDTLQKFTLINKGWKADSEQLKIDKKVYSNTSNFPGSGRSGGAEFWQDSVAWDEYERSGSAPQDVPFRPSQTQLSANEWASRRRDERWDEEHGKGRHPQHGIVQALPSAPRPLQQQSPKRESFVDKREPPEFANLIERERELAKKLNKRVNHGHYNLVLQSHPYNTSCHCQAFEYLSVNGKDGSDGWYLYASPFDDEDIILRHWFDSKNVTEERMIQLAGCDYIFEFTLGQRRWAALNDQDLVGGAISNDTDGFVVIRSTSAKMISTGLEQEQGIPH